MNNGLRITLITLLSILLIFVVGIMVFLFKGNYNFSTINFSFGESKTLVDEKEITSIKNLNIESNVADVIIETKEGYTNSIKVELYSDHAEEYEITEKNDEIKVVLKDKRVVTMFGSNSSRIKIYVPATYDKYVVITNRTGDITIGKLPNSDFNISLTTGDVKAEQANNMIISLTTGDVELNKVFNGDITATTGDVDINSIDKVKVKLTTGDITIGKISNSLSLTSTTGDVRITDANLKANSNIKSGTGDVRINNTTGCYIDAKTNVGDTRVDNNDRKSDIVLTITSRVGDIRVNK